MIEFKKILIPVALFISVLTNAWNFYYIDVLKQPVEAQKDTVTVKMADTLDEWEIFTLALMKVESDYDPTAVSSVGARGQPLSIYRNSRDRFTDTIYSCIQLW